MDTVDVNATNTEGLQNEHEKEATNTATTPPSREAQYPQTNINVFMEKKDKKKDKKEAKKEKKDNKKSKKQHTPAKGNK